jgi:hypothetical protein
MRCVFCVCLRAMGVALQYGGRSAESPSFAFAPLPPLALPCVAPLLLALLPVTGPGRPPPAGSRQPASRPGRGAGRPATRVCGVPWVKVLALAPQTQTPAEGRAATATGCLCLACLTHLPRNRTEALSSEFLLRVHQLRAHQQPSSEFTSSKFTSPVQGGRKAVGATRAG